MLGQDADDGGVCQDDKEGHPVGSEVQVLADDHHEEVVGLAQPAQEDRGDAGG